MTAKELSDGLGAKLLTKSGDKEVKCGYACDLLSWVMAKGQEGMAWITVQTHMNVIAVAALLEMAAVIIPEDIEVPAESISKAEEEGIAVIGTDKSAYELCVLMAQLGVAHT